MATTIREQCLQALRERLETMQEGEPAESPYSLTFSQVTRGPLGDSDARKRYSCGIVDGEESKQMRFPLVDCTLRVVVEFRMTVNRGDDDPSTEANRVLGDVQRRLCEDRTLGGLALDLREMGNELALESGDDKTIEGFLFLNLLYRHHADDPTKAV